MIGLLKRIYLNSLLFYFHGNLLNIFILYVRRGSVKLAQQFSMNTLTSNVRNLEINEQVDYFNDELHYSKF